MKGNFIYYEIMIIMIIIIIIIQSFVDLMNPLVPNYNNCKMKMKNGDHNSANAL